MGYFLFYPLVTLLTHKPRTRERHFLFEDDFSQIIPDDIVNRLSGGDLSDAELTTDDSLDPSDVLDRAVPPHTLLDVSAGRSKAELAHKGTMSLRSRPSSEALRSAVMRRSVSAASNFSSTNTVRLSFDISSRFRKCEPACPFPPHPPNNILDPYQYHSLLFEHFSRWR